VKPALGVELLPGLPRGRPATPIRGALTRCSLRRSGEATISGDATTRSARLVYRLDVSGMSRRSGVSAHGLSRVPAGHETSTLSKEECGTEGRWQTRAATAPPTPLRRAEMVPILHPEHRLPSEGREYEEAFSVASTPSTAEVPHKPHLRGEGPERGYRAGIGISFVAGFRPLSATRRGGRGAPAMTMAPVRTAPCGRFLEDIGGAHPDTNVPSRESLV